MFNDSIMYIINEIKLIGVVRFTQPHIQIY